MKKFALVVIAAVVGVLATPAHAAPTAPTNVSVVSTSPDGTATNAASASVSWTGSSDALSYAVDATPASGSSVRGSAANCAGTACTASLSGLIGGTEYDVVVTAIDNLGAEAKSAAFVFEAESVPFAPAVDEPLLSSGQIVLSWTAPDTGGLALTKYVIRATGFSADVAPNQTTYSSSSFTAGQNYEFTIAAENSLGESTRSTFTAITFATAPAAPAAASVTVSGSSITATWSEPANNGSAITSYSVFLVDSSGNDVGAARTPNPTTSRSLTINNVASGDYTIRVTATNGQGTSARSVASTVASVSSGSLSNTPVFDPAGLTSMDIGTSANLSVSAPSGGQVAVTVTASPSNACTYSGGQVFAAAAGTCTLAASVPATATYAAGEATKVITIKTAQSITFAPITSQTLPGPITLSASATSGLAVRFSASGPCSVSGTTLSFSTTGTCTVTATQPGNTAFSPAQQVVRSFSISTAPAGGITSGGTTGSVPSVTPRPPTGDGSSGSSSSTGAKVNAGSFKGYVALYAKGHKGKRLSAKVGKDWVIVPRLASDFERVVEYTGAGVRISVRLFIDRKLEQTINLTTK